MGRISKRTFAICTPGSTGALIERGRLAGATSRRPTGGCGRSGSPGWRTRSSSGRWSRCWKRSTSRTSSVSPTGSGRGVHRIKRWTRSRATKRRKVNWVLDGTSATLQPRSLVAWEVPRAPNADRRVLHLIQKWLRAGIVEDGQWSETDQGTPQGASVSTLLANVYLHYVFDLWIDHWRGRHARGEVIVGRYCDDFVVGFQHRDDAERFWAALRERFAKFGLGCTRRRRG